MNDTPRSERPQLISIPADVWGLVCTYLSLSQTVLLGSGVSKELCHAVFDNVRQNSVWEWLFLANARPEHLAHLQDAVRTSQKELKAKLPMRVGAGGAAHHRSGSNITNDTREQTAAMRPTTSGSKRASDKNTKLNTPARTATSTISKIVQTNTTTTTTTKSASFILVVTVVAAGTKGDFSNRVNWKSACYVFLLRSPIRIWTWLRPTSVHERMFGIDLSMLLSFSCCDDALLTGASTGGGEGDSLQETTTATVSVAFPKPRLDGAKGLKRPVVEYPFSSPQLLISKNFLQPPPTATQSSSSKTPAVTTTAAGSVDGSDVLDGSVPKSVLEQQLGISLHQDIMNEGKSVTLIMHHGQHTAENLCSFGLTQFLPNVIVGALGCGSRQNQEWKEHSNEDLSSAPSCSSTSDFPFSLATLEMMELESESLRDLMCRQPVLNQGRILALESGDQIGGSQVCNFSSIDECLKLLRIGIGLRTKEKCVFSESGKGHLIIRFRLRRKNQIVVGHDFFREDPPIQKFDIYLLDDAAKGISKTANLQERKGFALQNQGNIAISDCFTALADPTHPMVPWRSSKLTKMLASSFSSEEFFTGKRVVHSLGVISANVDRDWHTSDVLKLQDCLRLVNRHL